MLDIGRWKALEIQVSESPLAQPYSKVLHRPTDWTRFGFDPGCNIFYNPSALNSMALTACWRTRSCSKSVLGVFRKPSIRCASTAPTHNSSAECPTRKLAYYWDTAPPTATQLRRAQKFFGRAPPKLLFSASKFRTVDNSAIPEVAFLGRSNVGKSSLLNALMGKKICHTSSKPGRTRSMNFFAVGGEDGHGSPGKLAVLDMPGYGKGSREEWGPEIMKYLVGRKQYAKATERGKQLHLADKA